MKNLKKQIALILSAVMLASSNVYVFAAETETTAERLVNVAPLSEVSFMQGQNDETFKRVTTGSAQPGTVEKAEAMFDLQGENYDSTRVQPEGTVNYMIVDLKKSYAITKINITNYFVNEVTYTLYGSNDNHNYTALTVLNKDEGTKYKEDAEGQDYACELTFENPQEYRYYKLSPSSRSAMRIYNLEMYADIPLEENTEETEWSTDKVKYYVSDKSGNATDYNELEYSKLLNFNSQDIEMAKTENEINGVPVSYVQIDLLKEIPITALQYDGKSRGLKIEASKDGITYDRLMTSMTTSANQIAVIDSGKIVLPGSKYRYLRFYHYNEQWTGMTINGLKLWTVKYSEEYWKNLPAGKTWFNAVLGCGDNAELLPTDDQSNTYKPNLDNAKRYNMTDGNDTSSSNLQYAQSVIFDMGGTYTVGGIALKGSLTDNYAKTIEFYGSADKTNWTRLCDPITLTKNSSNYCDLDINKYFEYSDYEYIKIYFNGASWIPTPIINEFKVYAITDNDKVLTNIAANKDNGETSYIVTDGSYDTGIDVHTRTSGLASPWNDDSRYYAYYDLDLGASYAVKALRLYMGDAKGHYTVYGSADKENYTALVTLDYNNENSEGVYNKADSGKIYVKPGEYRYIRITTSSSRINLYELEVYEETGDSELVETKIADGKWTFTYKNGNPDTFEFKSIIAKYDTNGNLVDCTINNESVESGKIVTREYAIDSQYKTKCFVWKTIDSLESLGSAVEVSAAAN